MGTSDHPQDSAGDHNAEKWHKSSLPKRIIRASVAANRELNWRARLILIFFVAVLVFGIAYVVYLLVPKKFDAWGTIADPNGISILEGSCIQSGDREVLPDGLPVELRDANGQLVAESHVHYDKESAPLEWCGFTFRFEDVPAKNGPFTLSMNSFIIGTYSKEELDGFAYRLP